jgi:trk system potassium uptake protein TrkH
VALIHSVFTTRRRSTSNKALPRKINLSTLILLSYLSLIGIGTLALLLPFSTGPFGITPIDALFTATSAVCVTGLVVVDTGTVFSPMGQMTVALLIQIGGLGVMTFSVLLFLSLGKRVSFRHRLIMQEVFAHTPREDIFRVVRSIFVFTATVEGAGALLLSLFWMNEYSLLQAVHLGIFHAVSAFCNAGFSLFSTSFMDYRASPLINLIICSPIVSGGIGFPVVYEIRQRFASRVVKRPRLSIHTKSALISTTVLIAGGTAAFFWTEQGNILNGVSWSESIWISLFQSITVRTAGFNTVDMGQLANSTLLMMMALMFWGASPGSTGGGVKTTTFAVLCAFTWSRIRRMTYVNMFKKTLPQDTLTRSVALVVLSIGFISAIFFFLLLSQGEGSASSASRGEFVDYLFEVISAFGTVGLSTGVTARLNAVGKILIIIMMLIGRVGVLTFGYVLTGTEPRGGVRHAEQNLMIG